MVSKSSSSSKGCCEGHQRGKKEGGVVEADGAAPFPSLTQQHRKRKNLCRDVVQRLRLIHRLVELVDGQVVVQGGGRRRGDPGGQPLGGGVLGARGAAVTARHESGHYSREDDPTGVEYWDHAKVQVLREGVGPGSGLHVAFYGVLCPQPNTQHKSSESAWDEGEKKK